MFESKNKKIKYRNLRFKKELERARQYRRMPRQLPETALEHFWEKIGLGSFKAKLLTLLAFALFFYLAFIPNFLFVKNVEIAGNDLAHKPEHEAVVAAYLNRSKAWPQKNLLLLSAGGLKQALLADPWVVRVDSVKKTWPNHLRIQLTERREFALVETPSRRMIFSDDGRYLSTLDASSTPPIGLLKLSSREEISPGQALPDASLKLIAALQEKVPDICRSTVTGYALNPASNPDLEVHTAAGYKLLFDTNGDAGETLDNLAVLLNKLSPDDRNRLEYIDLRIKNKAYVCYKGTACTQAAKFQPPADTGQTASTSATSSLPTLP